MTARTHDLAAFTLLIVGFIYAPTLPTVNFLSVFLAFGANFLGGLFPDIDQPTSDFWDNFRLGPFIAKFICPLFGGHRHFSHSLIGLFTIGLLSNLLLQLIASVIIIPINVPVIWDAFMLGVISHLLMDIVTKEGLPLLWPLKLKIGVPPVKFLRVETGSIVEKAIVFPGLLILTTYLLYQHQVLFLAFLHQYLR